MGIREAVGPAGGMPPKGVALGAVSKAHVWGHPGEKKRDVSPLKTQLLPTGEANAAEKAQKLAAVYGGAMQRLSKPSLKAAVST